MAFSVKPRRRHGAARARCSLRYLIAAILLICLTSSQSMAEGPSAEQLLQPPDTSGPRETLQSFLQNVDLAVKRYLDDDSYDAREAWEASVRTAMDRATGCLNLSGVGDAFKVRRGVEASLQLKEVLQRVDLPAVTEIPGAGDSEADGPAIWRIPNTEIMIARIDSGPRAGEFLFTVETVDRAGEFYERVRHLPYRAADALPVYDIYVRASGYWIDPDWITGLPDWARIVVFGQTVWQLVGSILSIIVSIAVIVATAAWGKRWDERFRNRHVLFQFGEIAAAAVAIGVIVTLEFLLTEQLKLVGGLNVFTETSATVIKIIFVGWLGWKLLGRASDFVILGQGFARQSIDAHMVRVSTRLVSVVFIIGLIVHGASTLGIPLAPVLAGVGIGGAAIALAARPTLENVIGGFILFMDRPVRVGDFCQFDGNMGVVEEIGLRSTRIRTLGRTIITIPNADFSQLQLENFAQRDQTLLHLNVHLKRSTSEGQLNDWLARVRALLEKDVRVSEDFCRVRLVAFGEYSYETEIFAYVLTTDFAEFLEIKESILLGITAIVQDVGTELALPMQILASDGSVIERHS